MFLSIVRNTVFRDDNNLVYFLAFILLLMIIAINRKKGRLFITNIVLFILFNGVLGWKLLMDESQMGLLWLTAMGLYNLVHIVILLSVGLIKSSKSNRPNLY